MKNPEYDLDIIQPKHVDLLREIAEGNTRMRNGVPGLARRGLVCDDGLYAVKLTGAGQFALRGIFASAVVIVSETYKLDFLRGSVGVVESIQTLTCDADGIDQYGYTIHRARPVTSAVVKLTNHPGQWIFRSPDALVGLPMLKATINEYWRNHYVKGNTSPHG